MEVDNVCILIVRRRRRDWETIEVSKVPRLGHHDTVNRIKRWLGTDQCGFLPFVVFGSIEFAWLFKEVRKSHNAV